MSYKFDHAWERERERLGKIEEALDPWTVRAIEATNPAPGWRCLEVGGGGGSIAEWLCERVGPTGRVVATDLEIRFLEVIEAPNLEVRRHDVISDPLEEDCYDLIHTRAVLDHLPERDEVIPGLVAALRPGGWLVLEGGDFSSVRGVAGPEADEEFFRSAFFSILEVSRSFGMDPVYGRRIGTVLRNAGLERVHVEGLVLEWGADHPLAALFDLTFQRLRDAALEKGVLTSGDYDRLLGLMRSPGFRALSHTVYAARGRRSAR